MKTLVSATLALALAACAETQQPVAASPTTDAAFQQQLDAIKAECQRDNPHSDDWRLCLQLRGWSLIGPPPTPNANVSTTIVLPVEQHRPVPLYIPPAPPAPPLPVTCYPYSGYTRCW